MPLDFREPSSSHRNRRHPSATSLSSGTPRRILMLVGLLALVLLLMNEARKPANWQWLWILQAAANATAPDGGAPDTRVRPRDSAAELAAELGPIVRGSDSGPASLTTADQPLAPLAGPARQDVLPLAQIDVWTRLLGDLSEEPRETLLRGLKAARDQRPANAADLQAWLPLVEQLDLGWQRYATEARQAIPQEDNRLTDEEQQQWSDVLDRLERQWQDEVRPALTAVADPLPLEPNQSQALNALQATLDQVFLKSITDNTVFRSSEKDSWFRLLEDLSQRDPARLREASSGLVGFVQLYEQPDQYRGRLVTVGGTVRMGYYREAPENLYGIPGYYVFWLKPVGVNSPIVVYALEIPEGFPDVRALEAQGRESDLDEDLEFTGYFFKRWAYRAHDGTRLAPLLLAKTPTWEPRSGTSAAAESLPGLLFWLALLAGTGLFGVSFAACVWWFSRRSTRPAALRRVPPNTQKISPP